MSYVIEDSCIACGACAPECPVEAISEGDPIYIIDPDKCIDCAPARSLSTTLHSDRLRTKV